MAFGAGKYDDVCSLVREKTNADGVVLIVLGGDKGGGFSVQGDLALIEKLPSLLFNVARDIEADLRKEKPNA